MKLSEYIKSSPLSVSEATENLAVVIGCSAAAVKSWANGYRTPNKKWWLKIKSSTNGQVTIADFT
jgi:DNA-binding transcriptional regulator YdaS (Cro superfamily)